MGLKRKIRNALSKTFLKPVYHYVKRRFWNESKNKRELASVETWLNGYDKDHVWVFDSGNSGLDFRGNPKYLFAYINYYRPDIRAYWLCESEETIEQIRSLGFHGYITGSREASYALSKTGVAVSEQVRSAVPFNHKTKYLNLWHGNGYKKCERARIDDDDDLRLELAHKYIESTSYYRNYMIVCCVSALQEKYLSDYMGVPERNILRAGYARCTYQRDYRPIKSFDHDIRKANGLPADTKIAVYAPTFRAVRGNTFTEAVQDIARLYECCEKNHILFVFKMHPLMEDEVGFLTAKKQFQGKPYFLFWDNQNDIYEIINQIDLLIYDYSSIFNDFLLGGTKRFIRYIYDCDDMARLACVNNESEYYDNTCGTICTRFEDLIAALDEYNQTEVDAEILNRILAEQWEYSDKDDYERTVDFVLNFEPGEEQLPVLHSFDIFDTLISRKGLAPESIYAAMRDQIRGDASFSDHFINRFPELRYKAEYAVRRYMHHSREQRNTIKREVTLAQIYEHLQNLWDLTDAQIDYLMKLEQEQEIDSVIPLPAQIDHIKNLLENGETVILISDMYLPKETIRAMLKKADPVLATIPLFLSNEYGVLKTDKLLFFEVYRSFKPYYLFSKWIHTGDDENADQTQPRQFGICTRFINKPEYSPIETALTESVLRYDAFKVAALQARMRSEFVFERSRFVIDYVAPLMVSYVDYCLRDALEKGFETLYFVSRDGYPLKLIADALIEAHGWSFKTKYIYLSRRVLRLPSYVTEVDDEFFASYGGNFNDIHNKEKFLHAAQTNEAEWHELFPNIDLDRIDFDDWPEGIQPAKEIAKMLKENEPYNQFLLQKGREEREIVARYLLQEVDPNEKHAFIEFYGRGYNQKCHSRIWNEALGKSQPLHYYYVCAMLKSEGDCIRHRMTAAYRDIFFLEALFANMPYKSIESYHEENGKLVPDIEPVENDAELFSAMETLLPEYARRYAGLDLDLPSDTDRAVFDFLVDYYEENLMHPFIADNFGKLVDAVSLYGEKKEFAHPYTEEDIERFKDKIPRGRGTMSVPISYARSTPAVKQMYDELYQLDEEEDVRFGRWLEEREIKVNRDSKALLEEETLQTKRFYRYYRIACTRHKAEKRIVLVTGNKNPGDNYYSILKLLKDNSDYGWSVESCFNLNESQEKELADKLASAQIVIMEEGLSLFSGMYFREETTSIMLAENAFNIYKRGNASIKKLKEEQKLLQYRYNAHPSVIDAASEEDCRMAVSKYAINRNDTEIIEGSAVTDVYFSDSFRKNAVEKLQNLFPKTKEKKIILYLPQIRTTDMNPNRAEMLDLEQLQTLLHDYVVVIDVRNRAAKLDKMINKLDIPGFSKVINSRISTRELMVAADVIIGDYRDEMFESVLLNKPAFFTGFDYEIIQKSHNFRLDLTVEHPFPIVETSEELAEAISRADEYEYASFEEFRKKYFSYCDGNTAERIRSYLGGRTVEF